MEAYDWVEVKNEARAASYVRGVRVIDFYDVPMSNYETLKEV